MERQESTLSGHTRIAVVDHSIMQFSPSRGYLRAACDMPVSFLKHQFAASRLGAAKRRGFAYPSGTPALRIPSNIRSFPARKIGLSLS
jgi:hypothetical protein